MPPFWLVALILLLGGKVNLSLPYGISVGLDSTGKTPDGKNPSEAAIATSTWFQYSCQHPRQIREMFETQEDYIAATASKFGCSQEYLKSMKWFTDKVKEIFTKGSKLND